MNLLGAKLYDPAAAVSKATSSLLAMTAFDTTNLRLTVTVPAHGMLRIRMVTTIVGATTVPTILLGAMNGATVVGRQTPLDFPGTMNAATQSCPCIADYIATGLTPGSITLDAAYAVQVVVASTNIKYGGPNTNAGANAWGAFSFEIYDPQPMQTNGQLVIDANGRVDVSKVAGTSQTAGDIVANENTIAGYIDTEVAAIKAKTDQLTFTVANQIDSNVLDWKSATAPAMTGDAFARLGAPAGASVSADVAAIKSDTGAIKAAQIIATGTAAAGAASTITLQNALGADNLPNGCLIAITGGTGVGQCRVITGYINSTKVATVGHAWTTNPDATSVYYIINGDHPKVDLNLKVAGVVLTDTVTTYTGNTPQTGDTYARIGAPVGASISADIAGVQADTDNIQTRIPAALGANGNIKADVRDFSGTAGTFASGIPEVKVNSIAANAITAASINADAITDAKVASDVTIASVTGAVGSVTAGVTVTTNNDKTGYSLSAAAVQAIWDALTSVLTTVGSIGKLLVTNIDAAISSRSSYAGGDTSGTTTLLGRLTSGRATNLDNLDAAVSTRSTFAGGAVASVTGNVGGNVVGSVASVTAGVTVTTNNDKSGYSLSAAAVQAIWDALTSALTTVGSIGKLLVDKIDATISSRLASSSYTAPDNTTISAIAGYIDTEVAAIKAKTDNLPSSPAAASDIPTAAAIRTELDANSTKLAHLDADVSTRLATSGYTAPANADVASIKAKTDSLTFTVANKVDANVKSVNDVTVTGTGSSGDEWGP